MSKLSFRARALDASKPLPIYMSEELPDLPEYSAINRAVPQMPSGMEKEEECEHHLQRAIVTGLIIPTPEVTKLVDMVAYDRLYPPTYVPPPKLIRVQPFAMEEDYPDYDIDSEDEKWITMQKLDISPRKFEEMMDRLEKNCAQNFAAQDRKDLLLKDDDELSIAIYDYWLSKRLKTPHPLVPWVKTELNNKGGVGSGGGGGSNSNPYLAFRRRTEKMQTRKNRKNDEASYEKMIKLKRDLTRALTLLELVKRRETTKRQLLYATIQIYEKRYQANDLSGALLAEVSALKSVRPAFSPLYTNQYTTSNHNSWSLKTPKEEVGVPRKEKRQYKKRKHKSGIGVGGVMGIGGTSGGSGVLGGVGLGRVGVGIGGSLGGGASSSPEEEPPSPPSPSTQVAFPFLRNKNCSYHAPLVGGKLGEGSGKLDDRLRFSLTSLGPPSRRCIGLARRRIGRGGRVILDRAGPSMDDFWSSLDFTIQDNSGALSQPLRHFRPKSPGEIDSSGSEGGGGGGSSWLSLDIEGGGGEVTPIDLDLSELFPQTEAVALRREVIGRGGGGGEIPTTPPHHPPPPPSSTTSLPPLTGSSLLERWALSSASSSHRDSSSSSQVALPSSSSSSSPPHNTQPPSRSSDPQVFSPSPPMMLETLSSSLHGSSEFSITDSPKPNTTTTSSSTTTTTTTNGPLLDQRSWLSSGSLKGRESTQLLNSKLSGRSNSAEEEGGGGSSSGGVQSSPSSSRQQRLFPQGHPMEVT